MTAAATSRSQRSGSGGSPGDRGRRSPFRVVLYVVGLVAALGGVGWLLLGSGIFGVRHVVISGVHRLSVPAVRAAARIPDGAPLATLDSDAVEGRVRRLPGVADVSITEIWPSTVRLTVTERMPVAYLRGASPALIDAGAVSFPAAVGQPFPPAGLPALQVANPSPTDPATRAALRALVDLPSTLRARVLAVGAHTDSDVTLEFTGGISVVWGDAADSSRKAQVLAALLHQPGHHYDVSAPDLVTVR